MIDPTMISLPAAPKGKSGSAAAAVAAQAAPADAKADPKTDATGEPFASLLGGEAAQPSDPKAAKAGTADSSTPTAEELQAAIAAAAAALATQPAQPAAPAVVPAPAAPSVVAPAAAPDKALSAAVASVAKALTPLELATTAPAATDLAPAAPAAPTKETPVAVVAGTTKNADALKTKNTSDPTVLAPAASDPTPGAANGIVPAQIKDVLADLAPAAPAQAEVTDLAPAATAPVQPAETTQASAVATEMAATLTVIAAALPVDPAAAKKPAPAQAKLDVKPALAADAHVQAAPVEAARQPKPAAPAEPAAKIESPVAAVRHLEHESHDQEATVETAAAKMVEPSTNVIVPPVSHLDRSEFARIIGSVSGDRVPAGKIPEEIVNHVSELGKQGGGEIVFRLDPPGLGQLQIHVSVVDGKVDASITASSNQVAQALQQTISDLTTALVDRGLELGAFNVGADATGQQHREHNSNGRRSSGRRETADTSLGSAGPATRLTAASSLTQLDVLA